MDGEEMKNILEINAQGEGGLQKMITIYQLIERGRITSIADLKQYLKKAIEDVRGKHYKEVTP